MLGYAFKNIPNISLCKTECMGKFNSENFPISSCCDQAEVFMYGTKLEIFWTKFPHTFSLTLTYVRNVFKGFSKVA